MRLESQQRLKINSMKLNRWPKYTKAEIEAALNVLSSGKVNYWTGSECKAFEKEFAKYIGSKFGVALANGTMALEAGYRAIGIKEGDEIIATGMRIGENFYGGYSQYAKVSGESIIKKPESLSLRQSMVLGTAGFTALQCAFTTKQTREVLLLGEKVNDVIVTGASGGVGSIAVMILSKMGCNVTAVTSKDENKEYLNALGAKNIVKTSDLSGESRPLDKGLYDGAVDTVGGNVLAKVLSHIKHSGIVAACGNASSIKLNTTVMPFIIRGVKLWGIDSVNASVKRREFIWNEASKLIDFKKLEESIKEIGLEELLDIYPKMLEGKTSGRYIINVNK